MSKGSTVKEVNVYFVDKWIHSNSLINVQPEENCRIDELLCCSDVEVLVCKAIWKISSVGGRKMTNERRKTNDKRRTTKDERRTNELIGSNFCLIGPNSERLVRIRTIGPSPNDWRVWRCDRVERADVAKFVKVSNAQKKFWRGLT